jgi:NitT/TauT family transport system substrate-binding protein
MKGKSISHFGVFVILLMMVFVGACSLLGTPEPEDVTLRIAVLPVLDTLPLYVAEEQGFFEQNGVRVEFIPVGSAPERDQIIAAGQADGMVNELVSTLFYNREEIQIQVVRFARTATSEYPVFRILAAANSGVTSVEGLTEIEIGISDGTVIEYLTDRLLLAEGISESEIQKISVPSIGDRLALLNSGELAAAMLPDPLASLAIQSGATVVIDDTKHPEFGYSVISFRKDALDSYPEAIRGFLKAVEQAVAEINQDTGRWDTLLTERNLVPVPLIGTYPVPIFPTAGVPSEAQFEDAVDWASGKNLIEGEFMYGDSVNASFLP